LIDRRKEIGYPVQCGELLPHTDEMYSIFPRSTGLEELFDVDQSVIAGESSSVDMISPGGRTYRIPFSSHILDRRAFDKRMVNMAEEAGARIMKGVYLRSMDGDGVVETSAGQIRAKVIVGADGPNSRTARSAGLERPVPSYPAITCRTDSTFSDEVRMYFGDAAPGGYAWVIPKRRGANIGLGVSQRVRSAKPTKLLARFASRLGVSVEDVTLGFVPMAGPSKRTVSGRVMLVGDAAGHTMASNGGGIPTAMIAGREAGQVIRRYLDGAAALSDYETAWRSRMEGPLTRAYRTVRLADYAFRNEALLGFAMAFLGRRGLERAIRCKRPFP
jgi:digeranylgeranylglycerophospholipid reductase